MTLHILHLKNYSIYEQLLLEEALLRADNRSFCLINEGSSPSIVMGISSKAEELIDIKAAQKKKIPVIRRYSGGGCVVVDQNTLFVSLIMAKQDLDITLFPEKIHRWMETFYKNVFAHPHFALTENDYVIAKQKCGGNAQYIKKDRFVHHTTFLWDFTNELMQLLRYPQKTPNYRQGRDHLTFLTKLKEHFPKRASFVEKMKKELKAFFPVQNLELDELLPVKNLSYRKSVIKEI